MSMCSLVLVALERMSATVWPWRYRNTRTSKFMVAIAATWFVGLSIHGVLYYIMKYVIRRKVPMLAVLATILLLSITTICVSYVTIYLKLKWQRLQQQDPQDPRDPRQSSETQDQPTEAGLGNETTRPPGSLQRTMIKDRELALTLFIVTVSSLVSWLPYALMQVFALTISYRAIYAITLLQCTNSLMNPAIYALRMREFRSALIQFACKCSRYYPHVAPAEPNRTVQLSVAEI
ncbi:predicted protein [Nematostella vectensis]|uniref:G-protein coupled receptors family 1 profile domain-containing protein n=1 Tax=Nematostella vectensis TaxID=45351 RepID=A7TC80_NEMVE|nr:predicted protein [Nematostella vectensis]|eukprot:XP_001618457.1 hypothetical protein NEMVEDRAFT_v1g225122 [Nematostella vectensis]